MVKDSKHSKVGMTVNNLEDLPGKGSEKVNSAPLPNVKRTSLIFRLTENLLRGFQTNDLPLEDRSLFIASLIDIRTSLSYDKVFWKDASYHYLYV